MEDGGRSERCVGYLEGQGEGEVGDIMGVMSVQSQFLGIP